MSTYEVEQYEVWVSKVQVKAKDATEAIRKCLKGEGKPVDNSTEFVEIDETRGMSAEVADTLNIDTADITNPGWGIPTVRGIEVVEDD